MRSSSAVESFTPAARTCPATCVGSLAPTSVDREDDGKPQRPRNGELDQADPLFPGDDRKLVRAGKMPAENLPLEVGRLDRSSADGNVVEGV